MVHLSDDHEKERRHRKHHHDLADKSGRHPHRVHGYAYRLHNAWRITDADSKPVDMHITSEVLRAIRAKEENVSSSESTEAS